MEITNVTALSSHGLSTLFCVGAVCFGQTSQKNKSEESQLKQLQQEWIDAYYRGDVQKVSDLEAEDYTAADETGLVTKKEQIEGIKKRQQPDLHMTFEPENLNVRFYGPVALITFTAMIGSYESGTSESTHLIGTTVWTKHGGNWKADHIQYAELQQNK
jgi:ketosteroid isomerase-like protein